MRRILAILLSVFMLVSVIAVPVSAREGEQEDKPYVFTEADNALIEQDVFASIEAIKADAAQTCGGIGKMTEQDYAALVPQVIEAVEASETYVPGTLQQNGSFLVWETTVGLPCCYSPRMEAELHNTENEPSAEEIALAQERADALFEELSAVKGGWPSSAKIGLIQPYWESNSSYADSSFKPYSPSYKAAWQAFCTATGGEGMRYTMNNATVDNIASVMSQCGLVMFDSHGTTDYDGYNEDYTSHANSSYLCLITNAGVTSQDTQAKQGEFGTYYDCISGSGYAYVNGTCIANHMGENRAPHSFLYMGICLGMATDKMEAGLRDKGVEAVWGYSQSVSFVGDEKYLKDLMNYIKDGDTLAVAASKVKAQYGDWDPAYPNYSYSQCVANHIAFPIVASAEDPYPGHGNVDVIQTVNSTWTLYTQFIITALTNNPEWGTVQVDYQTITATPAYGYYVDDYEVVSGTANVSREGNVFTVEAESDCTIQINFAPRDPAVVQFSVPNGVSCESIEAYVGDEITLPEPQGEPAVESRSFRFLGWATSPMEADSLDCPEYLPAGTSFKLRSTETTFYALYTYFVAVEGLNDDQFVRVDEAPHTWPNEYVISYDGAYALGATTACFGSNVNNKLGTKKAVVDLSDAGLVYEDNILNGVTDDVTYVIEASENGTFTIKMKSTNQYLAMAADSDSLTAYTSSNSDKTRWTISYGPNGPVLTNAKYSNRFLQYDDSAKAFMCFNTAKKGLTLFAKAKGDNWFTTSPKEKVECEEHSFGEWVTDTEPKCTEAGSKHRICTVCGYKELGTIDALGHDYVAGEPVAPKCTEQGYTLYTCSRCEDSYKGDIVDAPGHSWDNGVVTMAPTLTEEGVRTFTCTVCGETKTEPIPVITNPFEDVLESDYFFNPVMWAISQDPQITSGVDATHFVPNNECTREQIVTFLWAANGKPIPEATESQFSDVTANDWYFKAVMWAVENKITSGMTDGSFGVGQPCTRAQAMTFLWASQDKPAPETAVSPFTDVSEGDWFCKAVLWAAENGITKGIGDGLFGVNNPCTRAQIITFLYKAYVPAEKN